MHLCLHVVLWPPHQFPNRRMWACHCLHWQIRVSVLRRNFKFSFRLNAETGPPASLQRNLVRGPSSLTAGRWVTPAQVLVTLWWDNPFRKSLLGSSVTPSLANVRCYPLRLFLALTEKPIEQGQVLKSQMCLPWNDLIVSHVTHLFLQHLGNAVAVWNPCK